GERRGSSHELRGDELMSLTTSLRAYPWRPPVGFDLGLSGDAAWTQDQRRADAFTLQNPARTDFQFSSFRTWLYEYRLVADLSAGYGRVRDATVVYEEYVLEQRLLES